MKDALASRTIYGMLILLLGPRLAELGITEETVNTVVDAVSVVVGVVLVLIGRQGAQKPIGSVAAIPLPKAMVPQTEETKQEVGT